MKPGLSLLTLNIGNPSAERAERQLAWLAGREEQVLILTETKASAGCNLLAGAFAGAGYTVFFPQPGPGEYGVMIITRVTAAPGGFGNRLRYLHSRAASVILLAHEQPAEVIGMYVPSRDASPEKTGRKREWLAGCDAALAGPPVKRRALLGDLNLLEPGHQPHYPFFAPFEYDFYESLTGTHGFTDAYRHLHPGAAEYSWVGRTGDGYRYDHAFCSREIAGRITSCEYIHESRLTRLTDHSGLSMHTDLEAPDELRVSDPAAACAPATLF